MSNQLGFKFDEQTAVAETAPEPQIYSVADLNALIRGHLEPRFTQVWVQGEISNFKRHTSGHFYFSLKDDSSQINAVMFKGQNLKLKFRPEDGLEVVVKGRITLYQPRGTYSINCETMEPVGAGALQKAFEQLKAKLQAEGLFDADRKRPLPEFPKHIGIVTSPTGAAIRDILNVLRRRYRAAKITLAPALVQGEAAPASIVSALQMITHVNDVDVVIVGRGGGSIEDLWCFNSEEVARAIAASPIPVISAVGHEVDFTIADFVADLRAPTPSAAAELVVRNATDLIERIQFQRNQLVQCMLHHLAQWRKDVKSLASQLIDPRRRLQDLIMRNDELISRLENAVRRYYEVRYTQLRMAQTRLCDLNDRRLRYQESRLREVVAKLNALNPLRVVERGYSVVKNSKGRITTDSSKLTVGENIAIQLAKGQVEATVTKILEK